ncbi:MAG: cytochrome b/b6 domain-containing protein [Marinifilaceae bacterium]
MAEERMYHYPVWVRIWHWINALTFIVLLITGISMQYSDPENALLVPFEQAVQYHNIMGVVLSINYLFFILGNLFTANGKYYRMARKGLFKRLMEQSKFYLFGMFQKEGPPFPLTPEEKFNPLQKVIYNVTMYLGFPVIIITGLALFFPETIIPKMFGVSGIFLTALLHVIVGFFLSLFLFIHVYVCTIGITVGANFKSMFTGWH